MQGTWLENRNNFFLFHCVPNLRMAFMAMVQVISSSLLDQNCGLNSQHMATDTMYLQRHNPKRSNHKLQNGKYCYIIWKYNTLFSFTVGTKSNSTSTSTTVTHPFYLLSIIDSLTHSCPPSFASLPTQSLSSLALRMIWSLTRTLYSRELWRSSCHFLLPSHRNTFRTIDHKTKNRWVRKKILILEKDTIDRLVRRLRVEQMTPFSFFSFSTSNALRRLHTIIAVEGHRGKKIAKEGSEPPCSAQVHLPHRSAREILHKGCFSFLPLKWS